MPPRHFAPDWNPERTLAYWINRTSRLILRQHEARLRAQGFSMGQVPVLLALEEAGPLSQSELAERAGVEQPTMAELLSRMERDGNVERGPHPDDRRSSLWTLAKSAAARMPALKAALLRGEEEATSSITAKEKTQMIACLRRVAAAMEQLPPPQR